MSIFGLYSEEIGDYTLGPVETETGTKFGVFHNDNLHGGPIGIFCCRPTAIAYMNQQAQADSHQQHEDHSNEHI